MVVRLPSHTLTSGSRSPSGRSLAARKGGSKPSTSVEPTYSAGGFGSSASFSSTSSSSSNGAFSRLKFMPVKESS
jgi:hypothetical protein